MQKFISLFVAAFIAATFFSCTIFKKEISKPVVIAVPDTLFKADIVNGTSFYPKYTGALLNEEITSAFLRGFKHEAGFTKNVKLQFSEAGADFILKLNYLKIEETSKPEKISDPKSPYNGQELIMNKVECSADFEIIDTKNPGKKLPGCSNIKNRSETPTNNRDLSDLINGTNKDKTQYRTKLLDDKIATNLAEDVGRRIWVPITRRVAKQIK